MEMEKMFLEEFFFFAITQIAVLALLFVLSFFIGVRDGIRDGALSFDFVFYPIPYFVLGLLVYVVLLIIFFVLRAIGYVNFDGVWYNYIILAVVSFMLIAPIIYIPKVGDKLRMLMF